MNAFRQASEVEAEALALLIPFLKDKDIQVTLTCEHPYIQKVIGDMVVKRGEQHKSAELKAEKTSASGNLFLESWSNRKRRTHGWMETCTANLLYYVFVEDRVL